MLATINLSRRVMACIQAHVAGMFVLLGKGGGNRSQRLSKSGCVQYDSWLVLNFERHLAAVPPPRRLASSHAPTLKFAFR